MFLDHDPSEFEQRSLSNVTGVVQREFGVQIQSITRSRRTWLATDELSPAASGLEFDQRACGVPSGRYARPAKAPPLTASTSPVT